MGKDELISRVILGTKRRNRPFSVVEIANYITSLKSYYPNLKEVAEVVGISENMLRRFLVTKKLNKKLQFLFEQRIIDSVTVAYYLNRFTQSEQELLSEIIAEKKINSKDIRSLGAFRNQYPDENIISLVNRLLSTKNIKISLVHIYIQNHPINLKKIQKVFEVEIGTDDFINIDVKGGILTLKFTKNGEKSLRANAKLKGLSLRKYIESKIF